MAYRKSLSEMLRGVTRFGRLTVLGEAEPKRFGQSVYRRALCRCDCGNLSKPLPDSLRSGRTTSCGCLTAEVATRHGMEKSSEYRAWVNMRARCKNPTDQSWSRYGGRGIAVCDRWRDSFEAFYADVGPRPTASHSIDRIDNDGNYEPGNVRWATALMQNQNRHNSLHVEMSGETVALREALRRLCIEDRYTQVRRRMARGLDFQEAISLYTAR